MAANYGTIKYEVTPNPLEMHNDSIVVTIRGTVPEKYMAKKAAIQISPELKYNGGTYPLNPITLKGEEVAGDGIAIPYKTGGTFTVKQTIPYMPGMSAADLVANPIIYKPAGAAVDGKATAQQIHANNKFIDVPSHKIADGVIITPLLIKHDEDLLAAADKLVKEKFASKEAAIYFLVNKDKLDWKLPLNKKKENKAALADLNTFINQGWQIKNIEVDGYASPEGEETFNQGLSAKRAVTGKDYVVKLFKKWAADKSATEFQKNLGGAMINTASKGEDWDGFMQAVQASNLKDKNAIVNIINSQSDVNKREQEIRNMTKVFKTLKADILPTLRRANITVNSYQPVKTDEQFLNAATNNPETLNVEELLYATTLTKDVNTQMAIYKATMKQNEGDWRAFNNAGEIELQNGNVSQAAADLNTANSLSPNNVIVLNNLGAVEARKGNVKAAADLFQKAQGLGANEGYNTGIPQIGKARYNDAVTALNVKKCNHNLGLAQLLAGNSAAAIATLKCAPAAADTYYLLAIAGARSNDTALLYENLMKSIKMDGSFKAKAAGDREFIRYFSVPEFQAIVK
jgi:outer membrane protein OmpA-like peptidoglycan-associated protein